MHDRGGAGDGLLLLSLSLLLLLELVQCGGGVVEVVPKGVERC